MSKTLRIGLVSGRGRRQRGQSIVEFSVVLPVLLALVGVVIDASRLYAAWLNLESAARDAAQYLAKSDTDPFAIDYTVAGANADGKAIYIVETALNQDFAASPRSGELTDCSAPQLTTTYTASTDWQIGGSIANPLSTAMVSVCMPFQTIFQYPFLTTDGAWTLRSDREITVIVGR